jgi:hypothetical protein
MKLIFGVVLITFYFVLQVASQSGSKTWEPAKVSLFCRIKRYVGVTFTG